MLNPLIRKGINMYLKSKNAVTPTTMILTRNFRFKSGKRNFWSLLSAMFFLRSLHLDAVNKNKINYTGTLILNSRVSSMVGAFFWGLNVRSANVI